MTLLGFKPTSSTQTGKALLASAKKLTPYLRMALEATDEHYETVDPALLSALPDIKTALIQVQTLAQLAQRVK